MDPIVLLDGGGVSVPSMDLSHPMIAQLDWNAGEYKGHVKALRYSVKVSIIKETFV